MLPIEACMSSQSNVQQGQNSCKEALRNQSEALWVKPKLQRSFQDTGSAAMTRCLARKSEACGGPDTAEMLCVLQAGKLER